MAEERRVHEARHALESVRQGRAAMVEAMLVPGWYWWLVAALAVAIGAAADTRRPSVIVATTVPAALLTAGSTAWMIAGRGRAQLSKEVLGRTGVLALMGFIWAAVGIGLASAFSLRAGGVPRPALLGTSITGLMLILAGPGLMRYLRRSMLGRPVRP